MGKRILFGSALLLLSLCINLSSTAYGQFSGMLGSKMDVMLKRKNQPQVYIMDPTISVRVKSMVATQSDYSRQMASILESELISRDDRLKPDPNNPETIISCDITRLESEDKWELRHTRESRKTGERQEWNDKKKKYETKPVYQEVEVTRNYKVVTGAINVSYQVKSVRTGLVLDSDTFPVNYQQEFLDGNNAPSSSDVDNLLIRKVVYSIIPRLVTTEESVKVLLAQKDLKDISRLGEAGLWQKMVEALEMMQPFKDTKKESYRLYNIGLGYEALAYQAEDLATTRKFLDKSSALYNQAIEMKPDEKYFREPQKRIESAILQYKKIEDQRIAYAKAKALKEQEEAMRQRPEPPKVVADNRGSKDITKSEGQQPIKADSPNGDRPLTNQDVINMASNGLDEANLVAAIKQATSVKFDLRPDAILNLLHNKVSNTVIANMRARQVATGSGARRARSKKG